MKKLWLLELQDLVHQMIFSNVIMIKVLHTGPFSVNTLIVPLNENKVFIVDPASCAFCKDENIISSYLLQNNLDPIAIVLTHGHFDHVSGLSYLRKIYPNIPILIHEKDKNMIGKNSQELQGLFLSYMGFEDFLSEVSDLPEATSFLEENKTLFQCFDSGIGSEIPSELKEWLILHTPGHTEGSVCLYNKSKKILISGDTLFYLSYGRTDLFGGSDNKMKKSLYRLSKEIDFCTKVFPGHERFDFELKENF